MSQAARGLEISLLAVVLFGLVADVAVREGSRASAWISAAAFLWFSVLAASWPWRLL